MGSKVKIRFEVQEDCSILCRRFTEHGEAQPIKYVEGKGIHPDLKYLGEENRNNWLAAVKQAGWTNLKDESGGW